MLTWFRPFNDLRFILYQPTRDLKNDGNISPWCVIFVLIVAATIHTETQVWFIGRKIAIRRSGDILWRYQENMGGKTYLYLSDASIRKQFWNGYLRAPSWVNRRLFLPEDRCLIRSSVVAFLLLFDVLGGSHGNLWLTRSLRFSSTKASPSDPCLLPIHGGGWGFLTF